MTAKITSFKPKLDLPPVSLLILAIGNDSRNDDGLGWAAAARLNAIPDLEVEMRYQLQVEDAELLSNYALVIFIDATQESFDLGFKWEQTLEQSSLHHMNTHALQPEEVLGLCRQVYGRIPLAYTLAISGYKWGLKTGLTNKAKKNLEGAIAFLMHWLNHAARKEERFKRVT